MSAEVVADRKERTMAHQLREPTRTAFDGSRDWLASLVDTFNTTEHLSQVPCGASDLRAMRARLSRPTTTNSTSRHGRHVQRYSPASCSRGS